MTNECEEKKTKDEVIALRKSAGESGKEGDNVFGTGLSHYILMDREDDK